MTPDVTDCPSCDGTGEEANWHGSELGVEVIGCPDCGGTGKVVYKDRVYCPACPTCLGDGFIDSLVCPDCKGTGI